MVDPSAPGRLSTSVKSLEVVLADGSVVEASPNQYSNIFNGVIGGYGGLGVITEVTLALTDNAKLKRQDRTISIGDYRRYSSTVCAVRQPPSFTMPIFIRTATTPSG
jgi:hypothetical protein